MVINPSFVAQGLGMSGPDTLLHTQHGTFTSEEMGVSKYDPPHP